ncbi:uncharacterized protein [Rutidosis leptorrhynchoides]|uniref:uncharacterized protein n=1 Tax=Rutidosis leptorrhynchoides TaxID=125765 RepID=UPI003A999025
MREAFPHAAIPKSLYELRKIIRDLGLENKDKIKCDVCQTSRYKQINNDSENESTTEANNDGDYEVKKVGAKVLRYFTLIPRLQRLFMSPKTAGLMRWHEESHTKDGRLKHPTDSPAWKTIDYENKEFTKEPHNVRLGLASDGFNPFRNMSVSHSTWPVVLMPYNLPPWLCMKKPFLFLSLLIPGPSAPGNNIDVYMQPLVDELKELWDTRVNTYDASTKRYFTLRASLLWTVSEFPAYANLSGWSTKGKLACPSCHKETRSTRLSNSHKEIFMAHRHWLESFHPFRMDKDSFDGTEEREGPPRSLTGEQVLAELKGFEIKFGKLVKDNPSLPYNWKKRNGKTKDHLKGRRDLEEMGIRHELHPEPLSNGKVYLPPACFKMVKPTPKMLGLKSHDNHILMQQLLPVAIRNILPKHVRSVIMKLCRCYRQLCSKVLNPNDLFNMEKDIGKILCDLERIFPPSFFDVMIHLSVHLASEARFGGRVHYCWKYPIEREHLNILSHQSPKKCKRDIQHLHSQEFEEWLSDYVDEDMTSRDNRIASDIETLAKGPNEVVNKYKGYIINGFRFHIKDVEKNRTTQNSGVILQALTSSLSSARDNDPIVGDVTYYGVLKDIIELQYGDEKKVVLFHCDWISSDPVRKDWKVVIKTTPRDNFDMDEQICIDDVETHLQSDTPMGPQLVENETIDMVRGDLDGAIVDDDTLVAAIDKNQIDHDQGQICECSTCVLEQGS